MKRKPSLPAGNPQTLAKSLNPYANANAGKKPVTRAQVAAIKYRAQSTGTPNIKGLPNFMHGKSAGKSMVLRGK